MPQVSLSLSEKSPLTKRILDAIDERWKVSSSKMSDMHQRWRDCEDRYTAFLPERDVDAERRIDRDTKGEVQYRTIMLPYSYAQLMSAHTYWCTVFLGRAPVFQFDGRHGEAAQQVQAMEALIDYQREVGMWLPSLYIWLLDVGKYGIGILGSYWAEEDAYVSEIQQQPVMLMDNVASGQFNKVRVTRRIPGYRGSKLYNVRPYQFFPDPRLPLCRFQEGEFVGVYNEVGWNEILRRKALGQYINIEELKKGQQIDGSIQTGHNTNDGKDKQTPDPVAGWIDPDSGEDTAKPDDLKDANRWGLYEWYIELVPSQWGLGSSDFPEKWVFTTNADRSILIGASPLGAIHNKFPFDLLEYEPDAYALFSRSLMEVLTPIQDTMDWLINSHFYNVRKALNDKFIVDPSKVVMKDVLADEPGGAIRLKPSAYGTDTRTVMSQLQVQDVTRAHLADLQLMNEFGQRITGVNDSVMGQLLTQGGRRTASEVRSSNTFSISRLKTIAEWFSASAWSPLSAKLVQNSQQYYDQETKFKIVGDLAQDAGTRFMQVTPDMIQGFYDFVPVDGTLPIDRFAQANLWRGMLADMARVPQVFAQYDMGRIFAWVARLAGLKNIAQFKIQVVPDATLQQQQQQGNVVPISAGGGAPIAPTSGLTPLQLEGMGSTL